MYFFVCVFLYCLLLCCLVVFDGFCLGKVITSMGKRELVAYFFIGL